MKILILGGTSKIAKNLIKYLKPKSEIYLLNRKKKSSHFYFDFEKQEGALHLLKEIPFDVVINCLGKIPSNIKSKEQCMRINSESIKIIKPYLDRNIHFIQLSTVAVYDQNPHDDYPKSESYTLKPFNDYGESKLKGEKNVEYIFKNHHIFRLPPVYFSKIDPTLTKRIIKNKFIEIEFNQDRSSHSFCSIENLCKVLEMSVNNIIPYGIYNVADEEPFKIRELKNLMPRDSLIKIKVSKYYFETLVVFFKKYRMEKIYKKINELYYKSSCNNLYSTDKLKNHHN